MKTIVVKTSKVVSHNTDMTPVYEVIHQKISPELTFNKWVVLIANQNYVAAEVIKVINTDFIDGKAIHTELDEIEKYNELVQNNLNPKKESAIDYKILSEKQSSEIADLKKLMINIEERLKANEDKTDDKSAERLKIESKANELNIQFRSSIGDSKLLEKINAIEPDFKLN